MEMKTEDQKGIEKITKKGKNGEERKKESRLEMSKGREGDVREYKKKEERKGKSKERKKSRKGLKVKRE